MDNRTLTALGIALLAAPGLSAPALAREAAAVQTPGQTPADDDTAANRAHAPRHTITAGAETQHYSDGYGSLQTATIEYKYVGGDSTVVFTPTVSERRVGGVGTTAVGASGAIYHDWSDTVSTRTQGFVGEDRPVFAHLDFAQDVTIAVAKGTTVTFGARWAEYYGNRDVTFLSLGVRRYFSGGSVAYRLTRTDPDNRDAFYGHLVNVTLDDAHGRGKTRLWLSAGTASLSQSELDGEISGDDYAAKLQRVQPLTDTFGLVLAAGVASYDRPGGRITGTSLGLGLSASLD